MRVIVLGGGLLGVTSAYYLQQLGHDVTVIDRHDVPCARARGRETAPEAILPLPTPPAPGRLAATAATLWRMAQQKAAAIASTFGTPPPDPAEHLVRLAAYSRSTVRALRDEAGVPQTPRSLGLLEFYMDQRAFEALVERTPRLQALGCDTALVSADEAVRIEPALMPMRAQLAGASYVAEDPMRDPAPAATSLVFRCRAAGVRFLTGHTVVALQPGEGRIKTLDVTDRDGQPLSMRADAFVLALGAGSVQQVDALDLGIPRLRLVREYTVTLPIKDASRAPQVTLHDHSGKLSVARVQTEAGDCLRVSARVPSGRDEEREPDSDRFEAILRRVALLLPGAADASRAQYATRMHAATADGLPLVGKTRFRNLFLNTAPGAQSWVNACGAGKSIARIVSGLRPELSFAFTGM